jgi:hypothetical protein
MNLPLILHVAIGLIFIYLILSLLASEIQELVATVLQWRAQHLRRSIEILLGGDVRDEEEAKVFQLVNQIYANPLIQILNQEAKGFFATLPRKATWAVGSLVRNIQATETGKKNQETVFGNGKNSAPSYISADIFANSLIDTLEIPTLVQNLTESRLIKFKNERLGEIQEVLDRLQESNNITNLNENTDKNTAENIDKKNQDFLKMMNQEFLEIQIEFDIICHNFQEKKVSITNSISRMAETLDRYIDTFQSELPENNVHGKALRKINFLRKDIFGDVERAIMLGGLRPNINEIVQALDKTSNIYEEISNNIREKDSQLHQRIETLLDKLPNSIASKIQVLANNTQNKLINTEDSVSFIKNEIVWVFNSSMERASGVYKRNSKGVALLIGLFLSISTNTDIFHIMTRLTKDSALRDTIVYNAGQILAQNPQPNGLDIDYLRRQADIAFTDMNLPIGWTDTNLKYQLNWTSESRKTFPFWKIIKLIPGWFFSAIAIAMGAPFWFDLLGKLVNVRGAGKPPKSSDSSN